MMNSWLLLTFRSIDIEHKITKNFLSLERAKEYILERRSQMESVRI